MRAQTTLHRCTLEAGRTPSSPQIGQMASSGPECPAWPVNPEPPFEADFADLSHRSLEPRPPDDRPPPRAFGRPHAVMAPGWNAQVRAARGALPVRDRPPWLCPWPSRWTAWVIEAATPWRRRLGPVPGAEGCSPRARNLGQAIPRRRPVRLLAPPSPSIARRSLGPVKARPADGEGAHRSSTRPSPGQRAEDRIRAEPSADRTGRRPRLRGDRPPVRWPTAFRFRSPRPSAACKGPTGLRRARSSPPPGGTGVRAGARPGTP